MANRCVIGLDLGGTNVRARAYFEDGTPASEKFSFPSSAQQGTQPVVQAIVRVVQEVQAHSEAKPEAIGMAVPGHIDDEEGIVRWSPNFGHEIEGVFHSWRNVRLKSLIAQQLELPIRMGNDANLAALGEYQFGVGGGKAKCLLMFTVGTGIGFGCVLGSEAVIGKSKGPLLLVGGNGGGAEFGHVVILDGGLDCNAGTYGTLEGHCQRDSIVKRATHRLKRGRESVLNEMVEDIGLLEPRHLFEAAEKGDELAIQVWQEVGHYLGVGVGNAINTFAPDVVAIGGQIANAGNWLLDPVRFAARDVAIPSLFEHAKIVHAKLGDDAGMLGGAALALQTLTD